MWQNFTTFNVLLAKPHCLPWIQINGTLGEVESRGSIYPHPKYYSRIYFMQQHFLQAPTDSSSTPTGKMRMKKSPPPSTNLPLSWTDKCCFCVYLYEHEGHVIELMSRYNELPRSALLTWTFILTGTNKLYRTDVRVPHEQQQKTSSTLHCGLRSWKVFQSRELVCPQLLCLFSFCWTLC